MPKATAADIGLNPLAWRLIALQLIIAVGAGCLAFSLHLSIVGWSGKAMTAAGLSLCAGLWLQFLLVPGKSGSRECRVAEMLFVLVLMSTMTFIAAVAQYPAIAVGLPYADPWLARADAALGVNVADLAHWTGRHPLISVLLAVSYHSYAPQLLLTILGLSALGDRARLWEFAFHYHICLVVALLAVVIWPAVCPPVHYGFTPTIDMTRLIGQIHGFHDGTMMRISLDDLDGLVSIPSFHAVGALIVAWAWRGHGRIFPLVAALNLVVLAATFVTGVHYLTDVLAGVVLFIGSVAVYQRWARRLLGRLDPRNPSNDESVRSLRNSSSVV